MNSELKLHPVLIRGVLQSLKDIFDGGFYADKVLERLFKRNKKWGSRDRRFIAETVYDIVRWWLKLAVLSGGDFTPGDDTGYVVRWAFYEAWKHDRDVTTLANQIAPDAHLDFRAIQRRLSTARLKPWEEVSFPEWLFKKISSDFGDASQRILESLNEPAPVCLRANRLKTNRSSLQLRLRAEGIETLPLESVGDGLILKNRQNVFVTKAFKEGLFEVQDSASQKVAPLLAPKPGERVADVCAGAGGKSLHLAALMNNKGSLVAGDISERKLEELKVRARRAGISNLRIEHFDSTKFVKRQAGNFDAVLIDAPCSGTGVIRRNGDTKWKLKEVDLERVITLQKEILDQYSRLVRPGGRLVYATCSILPEENQSQVRTFLEHHPDFALDGNALVTRPDIDHEDGFFAQRLIRRGP